ncbi:hypothetical protein WI38_23635 [Burkholderia ubonensis]|uniref:Uncharacterized protein n=1 Tax=Burkholderia ubonensis TaxID=101571 RepID=A0A102JKW2_9BURK|nr:hypothetical protein WI35_32905 [Burkholderia ubonensis]KUZ85904.1 hypothetical protein WI38_23635 [Burkholderia ubonensis]KUZ95712.1 hypothetical protein WI39_12820 [Burkholderia ubonensis]
MWLRRARAIRAGAGSSDQARQIDAPAVPARSRATRDDAPPLSAPPPAAGVTRQARLRGHFHQT